MDRYIGNRQMIDRWVTDEKWMDGYSHYVRWTRYMDGQTASR